MFDLHGWMVGGGGEKGKRRVFYLSTPSPLLPFDHRIPPPPLVQKSFYPQPSAVVKIKDSRYTFDPEKTEHSLAKITPVS